MDDEQLSSHMKIFFGSRALTLCALRYANEIVKEDMKKYFEREGKTNKTLPLVEATLRGDPLRDGEGEGGGERVACIAEKLRKNPGDTFHPDPLPHGERGDNF
jgi:hypothetical protein